jgi:hypothetical protein
VFVSAAAPRGHPSDRRLVAHRRCVVSCTVVPPAPLHSFAYAPAAARRGERTYGIGSSCLLVPHAYLRCVLYAWASSFSIHPSCNACMHMFRWAAGICCCCLCLGLVQFPNFCCFQILYHFCFYLTNII